MFNRQLHVVSNAHLLKLFYFTLKKNTWSEIFKQNKKIKFNSQMNQLGRQGPKYYILKHRLNSKNTKKLCVTYLLFLESIWGSFFAVTVYFRKWACKMRRSIKCLDSDWSNLFFSLLHNMPVFSWFFSKKSNFLF